MSLLDIDKRVMTVVIRSLQLVRHTHYLTKLIDHLFMTTVGKQSVREEPR